MEASTLLEVSLGKLPDYFNSVLIQIGKVFRETSQRDPKVASYISKVQSPEIIIRANDRFHEALDDVEIQLLWKPDIGFDGFVEFMQACLQGHVPTSTVPVPQAVLFLPCMSLPARFPSSETRLLRLTTTPGLSSAILLWKLLKAKAVMERDLALLRTRRAERERAAGVSRLRVSNEDRSFAEQAGSKATKPETPTEKLVVDDVKSEVGVNMAMVNTAADEKSGPRPEEDEVSSNRQEAKTELPKEIKDLSETLGKLPPAESASQVRTPLQGFDIDKMDSNNTTQISDVDFDSMFTDNAAPNNNESLNFDIEFSTDTGISQDLLQDNPFGDMTANNDFTSTSNENIDSLMPGIENYVNAHTTGNVSDDFTMLDMSANSAAFDSSSSSKPVPNTEIDFTSIDAAADTGMMEAPPVDSTFDDLFFDDSGDLGMGDGDISGDFGEFDDNWFKSDGQ